MRHALRETRDQLAVRAGAHARSRYAAERRMQLLALLVFAAIVLAGTAFCVGVKNVFLPGWWRLG